MKFRELFILIFVVFLFFVFEYAGWFFPVRKLFNDLVLPIYSFEMKLINKARVPYDFIVFSMSKSKYMDQLESKYVQSLSDLSNLEKLREENIELRKLIENKDLTIEETLITAPIVSLAYPAVGVGLEDGVEENNMVLFNDMLLGTIEEVGESQSSVSLLSRSRKKMVLAKTESGIEGVVNGNGRNILLTQIPRNIELINGERVVTVGQEGIARDTFIGIIRVIDNNPSAPTQTAIVIQEVSFYDVILLEVR